MDMYGDVRRVLAVGVCGLAIGVVGAGCDTFDRDHDNDTGRGGEVVSGGSGGARPSSVPSGAQVVDTGNGDLSYTASAAGTAYIVDATQGRLIVSRHLASGQRLVVEPDRDRVELDGQAIYQQNLEKNNRHSIWWQPDSGADQGASGGTTGEGALPAELRSAQRVATGTGDLTYTPPESGRIFVWDPRSRQIIHEAAVQRSDRVLVSPGSGTITVGSAFRRGVMMDPGRPYEIYFERP